ncbi:MAG: FecR domain-containing protein [Tannerella sp.]|jgi:ferric-dicitrate binding protein FerR (iron transport regulator)|nr:FecR domain-containing protein [Tannerella sp.]
MVQQKTDINGIIIRYLDGSATQEEKQTLLQWLKTSDTNRDEFAQTRDIWLLSGVALSENETDTDVALDRFRERILLMYSRMQPVRRPLKWWYSAAAVLLILLGMGYWFASQKNAPTEVIAVQKQLIAQNDKERFTLSDGTVVWLNAKSQLTCPETFVEDRRIVSLEGEGYFEVAEDKTKPFVVQAGSIAIEVLGTAFNIANYRSDSIIETVLVRGSVQVAGTSLGDNIRLKPDQMLVCGKTGKDAEVSATNAKRRADWTKDRLVFDNDCLADILVSMESWYKVRIKCPESFARRTRMSLTIRDEGIEEILRAMALIVPIRYSVRGNEVSITPK